MVAKASEKLISTTLAGVIQELRERLGMTQERFALVANLPLSQIQDLESGIELFLSPAARQRLSRTLRVSANTLKKYEKMGETIDRTPLSQEAREHWIEEMLHFPNEEYSCLLCQAPMVVRLFERKDLDDNPLVEVKAHCSKCLFKL